MGGRYLITGTQIGLLKAATIEKQTQILLKEIEKIEQKQFVWDSEEEFKNDLERVRHME